MGHTTLDIMSIKQPILLVIACYLYVFVLLIIYLLVFTAVLMGGPKFGALYVFWFLVLLIVLYN